MNVGSRDLSLETCSRAHSLWGLRLSFGLRRLGRGNGSTLALHVDAATEMSAFGNRHAGSDDVAVNRAVIPDVHLVAGGHIAGDFAEHDDRLGEHLSFNAAIR